MGHAQGLSGIQEPAGGQNVRSHQRETHQRHLFFLRSPYRSARGQWVDCKSLGMQQLWCVARPRRQCGSEYPDRVQVSDLRARERVVVRADSAEQRLSRSRGRDSISQGGGMRTGQVYLVGGAVRDEMLGLPASERDWVVVGATPEELESAGYRAVGREFPVFLHPETQEEYALARVERKTAPGYRGFETRFSPEVTLEQDLQRRDLTINAMARAPDGTLIDPYGGRHDLEQRLLRHVSPAFVEDPVRVLRVARFAARLSALGFKLAPETRDLMRFMVCNGEINSLVPERVWREMQRTLSAADPAVFFDILYDCGALAIVLPELEWDEAARRALQRAAAPAPAPTQVSAAHSAIEGSVRFAALLAGTALDKITVLCERLRVPND